MIIANPPRRDVHLLEPDKAVGWHKASQLARNERRSHFVWRGWVYAVRDAAHKICRPRELR